MKYLGIFVIKNPSSGIWSCPFSIITSKKNSLAVGTSMIEVYVIGRRFEKVKNGHIFEDWMSIRDWTLIWVLHIYWKNDIRVSYLLVNLFKQLNQDLVQFGKTYHRKTHVLLFDTIMKSTSTHCLCLTDNMLA